MPADEPALRQALTRVRAAWAITSETRLGRLQEACRVVTQALAGLLDAELRARCAPLFDARPDLLRVSWVQVTEDPPDPEDGARFHAQISAPRVELAHGEAPEALRLQVIAALKGLEDEELLLRYGDGVEVTVDRTGVHVQPWGPPDGR